MSAKIDLVGHSHGVTHILKIALHLLLWAVLRLERKSESRALYEKQT